MWRIQMQTIFGQERDLFFMNLALQEAQRACEQDEVPVGAIIVNADGEIIGRGYNQVETRHTQIAHAEMIALQDAGNRLQDWRFNVCWMYVTLEPCSMCMHAIRLHRLAGLIYGADSPLFGSHLDKKEFDSVYKNDTIQILYGIEKEKSEQLLRQFFKNKRENHG